VETRLAQYKKEAEERARQAAKDVEERERVRRDRLESERALKDGRFVTPAPPADSTARYINGGVSCITLARFESALACKDKS